MKRGEGSIWRRRAYRETRKGGRQKGEFGYKLRRKRLLYASQSISARQPPPISISFSFFLLRLFFFASAKDDSSKLTEK